MKKIKALSLLTLPLIATGIGIPILKISNNKDVSVQKKVKSTDEEIVKKGNIKDLALGNTHSNVIITDTLGHDQLYAWGDNSSGQLGIGTVGEYEILPQKVEYFPPDIELKNVESGRKNSAVVVENNLGEESLYVWGLNDKGQLGIGNTKDQSIPVENTYLPLGWKVKDLALSPGNFGGAVVTDLWNVDHLYMWGNNSSGQIGTGEVGVTEYKTPQEIEILPEYNEIKNLEVGNDFASVIIEDNLGKDRIFMWGGNSKGQLGIGNQENQTKPLEITNIFPSFSSIIDMELAFSFSSIALVDETGKNELYVWGNNSTGQIGVGGEADNSSYYSTPQKIASFSDGQEIKDISMGGSGSSMVITNLTGEDEIYTWGHNNWGQLGYDEPLYVTSPKKVEFSLEGELISFVESYDYSSIIMRDEFGQDHLYMLGNNSSGKFGNGETSSEINDSPVETDIFSASDSSSSTTFIDRKTNTKFSFQINLSNESGFDPELVGIYNSKGVIVGETELKEKKTKSVESYVFNSRIVDLENTINEKVYWSMDGGETLNLISEESFVIIDDNNVILYSLIGVIGIILLLLVLLLIVLILTRDKDDDLYLEVETKKESRKTKKQLKESQNEMNSILDSFKN